MKTARSALLLVVLVLGFATSCASKQEDCTALCIDAQAKSCSEFIPGSDCNALCNSLDAISLTGNCTAVADTWEACADSHDTCDPTGACTSDATVYTSCVGAFCQANQSNADCQAVFAATAAP